MSQYVHGYSTLEANRLRDQANSLANLLHHDSIWPPGSTVLEAGCGVGAQTRIVAPQNPDCKFVSIDISSASVAEAERVTNTAGINNVEFQQADIFDLSFADDTFDHLLICFVLEHLPQPAEALQGLSRVLKPGGSITLIEGDHGSTYFHPDSKAARQAIQCQVELQKRKGGDADIGRKLYPILVDAGFEQVRVSPRQVYVDDSNPAWVEGFTKNTFTAMIEGVAEEAVAEDLISSEEMAAGIADLHRTAAGGGTFCYTFFKGIGTLVKA